MQHSIAEKAAIGPCARFCGRDVDCPTRHRQRICCRVFPACRTLAARWLGLAISLMTAGWDCASGHSPPSRLASILLGCIRDDLASVYR